MATITNPTHIQTNDATGDGETPIADAAAALATEFDDNAIPLSAIDFTPVAGDDIQQMTFAVAGSNLNLQVGSSAGLLSGSIPLQNLANALMPLMAAAFTAMTPAQRRAWHVANKSPDGSGWTDSNGLYGEDDGLRGTAGYTDI